MRCKEVLKLLGVHRQTLSSYVKQGKIKVRKKFHDNFYDYDDDSVYEFIGKKSLKSNRKIISYSRVSTHAQKNQLKEQTLRIYNSCIARGLTLDEQIEDIKSGMNPDRDGFQKLIRMVISGKIRMVIIENKDRLTRFGFETLEMIFRYFGAEIVVLNDKLENKTYEEELAQDLISIIHYFSMKSYSHRRKLNKIRKELEEEDKKSINKCN